MSSLDAVPVHSTDLGRIAAAVAAHPDQLLPLVRFDGQERWHVQLYTRPDHEVWLLSWLPGQRTGLHDHGESAGAFAVVSGALTETTAARSVPRRGRPRLHARTITAGQVRAFGPAYVHEIVNAGNQPAVSVHAYGPALSRMRRYTLDLEAGLVQVSLERAGVDW